MNCTELLSMLQDFVDNELPGEQANELNKHLADCPECEKKRQAAMLYKQVMVSKMPRKNCAEGIKNGVHSAVAGYASTEA